MLMAKKIFWKRGNVKMRVVKELVGSHVNHLENGVLSKDRGRAE